MTRRAGEPPPRLTGSKPGFPTRLAVLLTSAMAASAVLQLAVGALAPTLTDDLDISRPKLGALVAVYYLVAASLSGTLGRGVDAIESKFALGAVFVGSALSLLMGAVAPSYLVLLVALVPAGAVAALANPATNKVLATLEGRRGPLTGLKQSGVHLGALVAGGVVPPLAALLGWRWALACLALVSLVGVTFVAWLPKREDGEATAAPAREMHGGLAAAVSVVPTRRLGVYALFSGAGLSAVLTFLPLYGTERMGLGPTAAGMLLGVMAFAGLVSSVGWGWLAERGARATGVAGWPLPWLAGSAAVATILIAAAPELGLWSLWLAVVMLGLTVLAANAIVMLVLVSTAPAGTAGHASGQVLTAFFLGLCVAAPLFGAVVDSTDRYTTGWLLTTAAFLVATVISLPFITFDRNRAMASRASSDQTS